MKEYVIRHHGILGQKWGVRRFQNSDGTRTAAGKRREQELENKSAKNIEKMDAKYSKARAKYDKKLSSLYDKAMKEDKNTPYSSSVWKKVNSVEDKANRSLKKIADIYGKKNEKLAKKYLAKYFKDHKTFSYNDLIKNYDYSQPAIDAVLSNYYSIELTDDGFVARKK